MKTAAQRLALALRIILGSASFAGVLTMLTVAKASAQTSGSPAVSEPPDYPEPLEYEAPTPAESPAQTGDVDPEQPPDTNLETGLPLNVLLTPFRWGRFSFLSVTASQGYSSNSEFQKVPVGAYVTSISTLALYSTEFAGWQMNLQYQPFLWISSSRTIKDFAAASLDLRNSGHLNDNWRWTVAERFRYSPTHSSAQGTGVVANPGGGFGIGNVFLSSGRNVMTNGIATTLTDHYAEYSTLTFHANTDFIRLSKYIAGPTSANLPTQQALTFSTGVTWRKKFSLKDTFSLESVYRFQTSSGTSASDVHSQNASIGLSHKLSSSLGIAGTIGPAWSFYPGRQGARATLHGSLALSKEFRGGGAVLSVGRSESFSGVISDRFSNRAELTVHREFSQRWSCTAALSYVEQQLSNERASKGKLASASVHYYLSPNWAVFGQVRYLDIQGSDRIVGPGTMATVGVRWAWVPQKP
jgi:hypothetical protein